MSLLVVPEDSLAARLWDLGFLLFYLLGVGFCLKVIWNGLRDYLREREQP